MFHLRIAGDLQLVIDLTQEALKRLARSDNTRQSIPRRIEELAEIARNDQTALSFEIEPLVVGLVFQHQERRDSAADAELLAVRGDQPDRASDRCSASSDATAISPQPRAARSLTDRLRRVFLRRTSCPGTCPSTTMVVWPG